MKPITIMTGTHTAPRDEWLAVRRKMIGASEASAVIMNEYNGRMGVYLDKRGEAPQEHFDEDSQQRMDWGLRLEDAVASKFSEDTGMKARNTNRILVHPKTPFIGCNIDRRIEPSDGRGPGVLEIKTTSVFAFNKTWDVNDDGTVTPPDRVLLQVAQQQYVSGLDYGYVAVLVGGQRMFISRLLERDQAVENLIVEKETEFWEKVQAGIPPIADIDGSSSMEELLKRMYPVGEGTVDLGDDAPGNVDEYLKARAERLAAEKIEKEFKNKLRYALGDNERAIVGDNEVMWKHSKDKEETDWDEMEKQYPMQMTAMRDQKATLEELARGHKKTVKGSRRFSVKEIVTDGDE